jgi:hypothetical protein
MHDNNSFIQHMLANRDFKTLGYAKLEQSVIRAIYKLHNADARFNWELKECNRQKQTLALPWFIENFPAFPAILRVAKVEHVFDVSWTALFGPTFFKQPWAAEYLELVDELQVNLRKEWFAMVFRVPHAKQANLMVMHNVPDDLLLVESELTCIMRVKDRIRYVIEPLASFLERTGDGWFQHAFENPED